MCCALIAKYTLQTGIKHRSIIHRHDQYKYLRFPHPSINHSARSNPILLRDRNLKFRSVRGDISLADGHMFANTTVPDMLDLDVPHGIGLWFDNRSHFLVVAGLVVLLCICPRACGVKSWSVVCLDTLNIEFVGATTGGTAGGEVGDVPG